MYYHVLVSQNSNSEFLFRNLSTNSLKSKFLKPYKKNKKMYLNGKYHSLETFDYTKIYKTKDTLDNEVTKATDHHWEETKKFNANNSKVTIIPSFYSEKDIASFSIDITEELLTQPPSNHNLVNDLFYNPYVIAVITAVIGAGIIYYLKLN